ncbi:protein of unknown function [Moritella yayanosii]|uniref:Uncharacterized protein n=1 Tax=Moritella yayanosii TaxID=69539 RepID=A0A330LN22_9GAMM|nr:protein of unknown function [Moritella yayanosii]
MTASSSLSTNFRNMSLSVNNIYIIPVFDGKLAVFTKPK